MQIEFCQADVSDAAAVDAAFRKPWPDTHDGPEPEVTVFHTAAIIRFYERKERLQPYSDTINVTGTENVIASARKIGASTLVYTSSGSVSVKSNRFLRWPWEGAPEYGVQVINGDDEQVPTRHGDFFSNYAVSKWKAEKIVRAANGSSSGKHTLHTGAIRPGNGIYGPGGDLLVDQYMVRKDNPSWIFDMIQSFVYVENVSLAHLCYEARLIERAQGGTNPDLSGKSFVVADGGAPPSYGEVYGALTLLSGGAVRFTRLPSTALLLFATVLEQYYLARIALLRIAPALGELVPPLGRDVVFLQPSLWALTQVHMVFDDSRARAPPEKGGLGYAGRITTIQGVCKVVAARKQGGGKAPVRQVDSPDHGFPLAARAEKGVEEVIGKLGIAHSVDKPPVPAQLDL